MTTWTMPGLDFMMLCSRFGRDRLPYPLAVTIDVDTVDELRQLRREASARIDAMMDEKLGAAVRTVVDPIVRIECRGETTDSRYGIKRSHAAIRHDIAAVLTQQPGPDASAGGAVTIELTGPAHAPAVVLGSVPNIAAGHRPAERLERADAAATSGGTHLSTATRGATADEQFRSYFDRPRSAVGEIIVARGMTYDNRRDTDAVSFFWMDFERDGRYIVHSAESIHIAPADTAGLASEIGRHVAVALRR
ncbi:ESX secretion-associated protein EspG [Rhodococcus sp. IEGM 1330]|uniref:ESX secretion-associated protein EspG n=1 Tax=Rhodococcus sp. IEGM 1330 TaxID=3082225 RepID=UPI002952CC48|nr:ESX secretion-associated protein EspG [Rhodococcus sp. IEGM 1330]MDV8021126.1 ESX secretion-associated protein EspG [Rhodococcus sp. IEGM 1330]